MEEILIWGRTKWRQYFQLTCFYSTAHSNSSAKQWQKELSVLILWILFDTQKGGFWAFYLDFTHRHEIASSIKNTRYGFLLWEDPQFINLKNNLFDNLHGSEKYHSTTFPVGKSGKCELPIPNTSDTLLLLWVQSTVSGATAMKVEILLRIVCVWE